MNSFNLIIIFIICNKIILQGLRPCTETEFQCSPGECIAESWLCDHQEDCENGADEKDCHSKFFFFHIVGKRENAERQMHDNVFGMD